MRTHGTLVKWNDDRGFGFIAPAEGAAEIFVHISAFPRDGVRPKLNELISFETETGPEGKPRAVRVMRAGRKSVAHAPPAVRRAGGNPGLGGSILIVLAIAAIGVCVFPRFTQTADSMPAFPAGAVSSAPSVSFTCDGRTLCSQMTSCAEARYFIQHCPGTAMDGDGDGEPCEQQWCH